MDDQEPSKRRRRMRNGLPKLFDGTFFNVKHITADKIIAICRSCNRELSGSTTSTGNFFSHMKRLHPETLTDCRAYINGSSTKCFMSPLEGSSSEFFLPQKNENLQLSNSDYQVFTPKQELDDQSINSSFCEDDKSFLQKSFQNQVYENQHRSSQKVLNFVLTEMIPCSTVDNSSFHELFQDDSVPPTHVLREDLNQSYNQHLISVRRFLRNQSNVSIIVNGSSGNSQRILGILATVLDEYFNRKNILLDIRKYCNSENFENVMNFVSSTLHKFDIPIEKVSSILYGNGVTFDSRNYEFDEQFEIIAEEQKHQNFEKIKNFQSTIQSSIHLLDLAYKDALEHTKTSEEFQFFQGVCSKLKIFWSHLKGKFFCKDFGILKFVVGWY